MVSARVDAPGSSRLHVARAVVVSIITMLAVLIGLFMMPSMAASAADSGLTPAASSAHGHAIAASSGVGNVTFLNAAAGEAAMTATPGVAVPVPAHGDSGPSPLHCALIGMVCALLFVLVSMVALAVRPSTWLSRVGPLFPAVAFAPVLLLEVHRPNLRLLCISRT